MGEPAQLKGTGASGDWPHWCFTPEPKGIDSGDIIMVPMSFFLSFFLFFFKLFFAIVFR